LYNKVKEEIYLHMQTKKSVKHNRYKFKVGDYAWIVPEDAQDDHDDSHKVLVRVKKRLLRPFADSVNYYLCEHQMGSRRFNKIHYETEMRYLEDSRELI
jgi:hypothetical protein